MNAIGYVIVILGLLNIIRMMLYLMGSDAYTLKRAVRRYQQAAKSPYRPTVTVLVPAHNEGIIIERTLNSLQKSNYPKSKMDIIVVNDGSTDNTSQIVRNYIARQAEQKKPGFKITLVDQDNGGKADALNNGIKNYATGTLVMCLDGDSMVHPDCIKNAVQYFRDPKTAALASNVTIVENQTLLGLVQRFEYLVSYQMKKAQTTFNTEYIIGGIGSMFRRSMLRQVNYYDTNTMTEDIDLTMKIIARGNREHRVVYASDAITYTEPVLKLSSLIKQRFRWKYGRMQTFLKNPRLFFSPRRKYAKQLTWLVLPLAVLYELQFLIEPLFVLYILGVSIIFHDPTTIIIAESILSFYMILNVWASEHLPIRERLRLSAIAPAMYALMYILGIVEYCALLKSIVKLHKLPQSIRGERTTWISPERNANQKAVA